MQFVLLTNRNSLLDFIKNKATIYCEKNSYAHKYCKEKKIKHFTYSNKKSVFRILKSNKNNRVIFNGLKYIIPKNIIELFKHKIINIHPSLLPSYKGQFVINKIYANNEKFIGATIHEVSSKVDSGKILSQLRISRPKDLWVVEFYHILFKIELLLLKNFFKKKIKKYKIINKNNTKLSAKKKIYSLEEIKKLKPIEIASYCVPNKFLKFVINRKIYKILHIEKSNVKMLNDFKNYKFLSSNHLLIKSRNNYYKILVNQ
jgi:phosphoribosylglycinamide formyltransferase-1